MTKPAYSSYVPLSMRDELSSWNSGSGIDLETWVGREGRFALAVGHTTVFWPEFEVIGGYIVRRGTDPSVVEDFERQAGATRWSVENTLNHMHLIDLHYLGCPDASPDKLLVLGNALQKIYEAKLQFEFPDRPCTVRFFVPENADDVDGYQISFWQCEHEAT